MFAVTVEPLNSVFFLAEDPGDIPWSAGAGVEPDLPSNYDLWSEGSPRPEQVICVSTSEPKHYKVFKYSRDVDPREFRPTGKTFGGIFSRRSWQRFQETLPKHLPFLNIPDDDPQGTVRHPLPTFPGSR